MVRSSRKDFDELEVGERFTTEGRRDRVTDIIAFAELTGDTHPQHTDAEWARVSLFGEQIAHGLLVLSARPAWCRSTPSGWSRCASVSDAVFKPPVKIGDTVHVEGEITKPGRSTTSTAWSSAAGEVLNQDGKLVLGVASRWCGGAERRGRPSPPTSDSVLI